MRLAALLAFVLLVTSFASQAASQTSQGRLTGTVKDEQDAVLPGVTVVATSPALIGTRTTLTESDGRFLFPALPSGVYTLTFTLSNFKTVAREGVVLTVGTTITVDAQLVLAEVRESVVVTDASPVVDVATTRVAAHLKDDSLIAVPNSTDMWGALSQSPGIRMQGFDVGGSHKGNQSFYEAFGIEGQVRVITEGIDHTQGSGAAGFYEDYFASEEISVSALGSDVEMNSGGAAIVTMSKSGGNTFKGLYHLTYESGAWVADNNTPALAARGYTGNPNLLFWEGHADLGGPIKQDRLWFFYAFNHFTLDRVASGVPQSVATDLGLYDNHTAKGTWRASANDTVIGYYQQNRKQRPHAGISVLTPPESAVAQDSMFRMSKAEWQRVLTPRAFLDVTAGRWWWDWPMTTDTDAVFHPPTVAIDTGRTTGAPFDLGNLETSKPQVKAQLTYYLANAIGSHDFKFGYETMYDWYRFGANGITGPIQYRTRDGVPVRVRFLDVGTAADYGRAWGPSSNLDLHHTAYAQDRWSPTSRLSVTAGVRLDYQDVSYGSSTRRPLITEPVFPSVSQVSGQTLVQPTNVAPRIGVAYDVTGQRQTVLKAFYGRYYNNLVDTFSGANPGTDNLAEYNFNDLNHNGRYDGPQELGALRFRLGGASASVNPNVRTSYVEEWSGSVEHQFWGESSVRGTVVRKTIHDFVTGYPPAWVGQVTVPTTVTVTGPTGQPEVYHVFDIPESLVGQSDIVYDNIPDSDFHYTTLEVAFNGHAGRRFFAQISGDYQWRDELLIPNPDTRPLVTDPVGKNFFLNPNPAVPNRQRTTTYHLQAFGRYVWPHDVGVAVNYRYQSGFPFSRIIPDGELPNLSPAAFFVENPDHHRSDNVSLLNLRIDKAFTLGKATLTAMVDVDNVFNANPVTNFNLLNDGFGQVIGVLSPRATLVGLRVMF